MVRFIKGLDKYSAKFLGRSQVFLMDLAISIVCSIGVAIVSFFLDQSIFLDRTFDLVWGLAAGLGSALMYWLLKTYVIVIRHFSFKDTFVLGAAALGKVLVLSVVAILFGKMHREMAVLLLFDMVATIVAQCTVRLLMIYVYDSYKKQVRELERRIGGIAYHVIKIDKKRALIDLGSTKGAARGDLYGVYEEGELIRDLNGNVIGAEKVFHALLKIVEVHPTYSVCAYVKGKGGPASIRIGDLLDQVDRGKAARSLIVTPERVAPDDPQQ